MALLLPFIQQFWLELQNLSLFNSHAIFSMLIAFAFSLLMYNRLRNHGCHEFTSPPSPPKLPIIGNLHQLGTLPHRSLQTLSKIYGPIMLMHIGSTPTLVISSAELVQEMTKSHDIIFSDRPKKLAAKILLYGCQDIAFGNYDEKWRQARKVCALQLLSLNRVHSFLPVREEEVARMIETIRYSCSKTGNSPVNMSDLLLFSSGNIMSRCVFKKRLGKEEEDGAGNRLSELAKTILKHLASVCYGDLFPWFGWVDVLSGFVPSMKRTSKEWNQCLDQVIEERKMSEDIDDQDFVDILLELQSDEDSRHVVTQDMFKAILTDMIGAGTETSSTTMEWIMAQLIKNPPKMRRVQEEVRRVIGKKAKIEKSDVDLMEYLKCVIKETMRLNCPLPLLVPRETSADIKLGGYDVRAKTQVLVNAWAIQRDPEIWGDDAEKFIPERFENSPIDFKGKDFEFIPFGFGRRGCPGISFGVAAIEYSIASLLYWFDWALPEGLAVEDLDMNEIFMFSAPRKVPLILVPTMYSPEKIAQHYH